MTTKLPTSWPVQVKVGSAGVKIYRIETTKKGANYVEFRVAFYDSEGVRKFRSFADFDVAKDHARQVAVMIAGGESKTLNLSADEAQDYRRAKAALKGLGVALGAAAAEFADAKRILPDRSLVEAARHYRATVAPILEQPITVADAVDQFILTKRTVGRSEAHLRGLNTRLGRFADCFNCRLSSVKREDVAAWLAEMSKAKLSGRSVNNYLEAVSSLMEHGRKQGWTVLDLSGVDRFAETAGEVQIFTVAEWVRLLAAAREEILPFLCLGGFAGIRSAEISRMTWAGVHFETDVHYTHGWIELRASQSKNAAKLGARARRLIPMQANLRAWLEPRRAAADAPVCRLSKLEDHLAQLAKNAKTPWKKNGPRHSYGSYRLAQTHDEAKVSLEMGNSPQMIFAHYRSVVSAAQAEAWFGIMPD
jgi:hypothetical protein